MSGVSEKYAASLPEIKPLNSNMTTSSMHIKTDSGVTGWSLIWLKPVRILWYKSVSKLLRIMILRLSQGSEWRVEIEVGIVCLVVAALWLAECRIADVFVGLTVVCSLAT